MKFTDSSWDAGLKVLIPQALYSVSTASAAFDTNPYENEVTFLWDAYPTPPLPGAYVQVEHSVNGVSGWQVVPSDAVSDGFPQFNFFQAGRLRNIKTVDLRKTYRYLRVAIVLFSGWIVCSCFVAAEPKAINPPDNTGV